MTTKLLANQYKNILADPVEGFTVELEDEASLFEWKVFIEGPKDTCYDGGVFQLRLSFPKDYPMSPPVLKFVSDFWHPNVYHDGKVCMSILHPPGEDAMSGELAEERWLPTQSVTTIVLSLMSLLNDPNCSSPANVDASVEWRKQRESYINKCKKLVEKANKEKPAHVQIPHPDTNEEEHKKIVQKWKEMNTGMDAEDFYEPNEEDDEEESDDENENEFLESNSESESLEENEEDAKESESKPNGADVKEKGKMGDSAEISKPALNSPEPILVVEPSKKPEQAVPTPVPAIDNPPVEKQPIESGPSSVPLAANPVTNIVKEKEEIVVDSNVNNQPQPEAGSSSSGKGKKQKNIKSSKKKKCTIM